MAVFIEAQYQKKIGLPAYSSHAFSVTIRTEISDLSDVQRQASQLYSLLQESVDRNIQEVGFIPDGNGNGQPSSAPLATNGHTDHKSNGEAWACSDKQRDLIKKIVDEHKLDKQEVEALSKDMFNAPVEALNKMDASSLIAELISNTAQPKPTVATAMVVVSINGEANDRGRANQQRLQLQVHH